MIHGHDFYIHALRSQLSYDPGGRLGGGGLIYATVYAEATNGARTTDDPQNHFDSRH